MEFLSINLTDGSDSIYGLFFLKAVHKVNLIESHTALP